VRFEVDTLARLRRQIMKRGFDLSTMLSEVLAGKKPTGLAALAGKPGMRPEEKLRMALDQVESRRKLIDAMDDRFGRCDVCSEDLGLPALGELPWADRCAAHAHQ
jgi:hypothetical protein